MAPYPADLASFLARSERYWFRGIILASVGYGIGICLYFACVNRLISRITGSNPTQPPLTRTRRRWDIFSLVYITFMVACSTMSILAEGITGEHAYVDHRSDLGGPPEYFFDHTFQHVTILKAAYISFVLCNWGATGLMMWRCLIIYRCAVGPLIINTCFRKPILYMIIPAFLALASIACGTIFLVQTLSPMHLPSSMRSLNWTVIWGSVAVALMWTLTGMITLKLLVHRQDMKKIVGEKYYLDYTSIAAMLVESSGILSSFSVFYLVISPLLIVYRVASGRAWTRHAVRSLESLPVSSPVFEPGAISGSTLRPAGSTVFFELQEETAAQNTLEPDGEECPKPTMASTMEELKKLVEDPLEKEKRAMRQRSKSSGERMGARQMLHEESISEFSAQHRTNSL
ncbi:hypothetical protein NP233_g9010 [Leucocoprinus birnbaumii]|uniref:Uncharacterized protein n=1 Tax=Leucocoprinus birnbaumii TaxID=56174 RepID=A0AAD5YT74_9AGAR|nr:hypothetical protein NP233_g9010 [Leucocoprinus birnbaumii]